MRTDWRGMELAEAYPLYLLHLCPPEELPWVAVNELLAGRGGDAVAQLAGLTRPTSRDVDDVLPGVLRELGIERLSPQDAWTRQVGACLDDIVRGAVDPSAGAFRLWKLQQENPDRMEDLDEAAFQLVYCIAWDFGSMVDDEDLTPEERAEAAEGIMEAARELRALI